MIERTDRSAKGVSETRTIHQYQLAHAYNRILLPEDFVPLHVAVQAGASEFSPEEMPCFWALVDKTKSAREEQIVLFSTGHEITLPPSKYLGTVHLYRGSFVLHAFFDGASAVTTLPALTVWQPWASLIIAGAKPYEFRSWSAPRAYRGKRIAIHAGARKVAIAELRALRLKLRGPNETGLNPAIALPLLERWTQDPRALPLASVLGTARLGEPVRAHAIPAFADRFVNDSERDAHANWAWPLTEIVPIEPPVPARGEQGFWSWRMGEIAA